MYHHLPLIGIKGRVTSSSYEKDGETYYLDLFYTQEETLHALLAGLKALFGTYTPNSYERGSELIEILLMEGYKKYVKDLIPADFIELIEILMVLNLDY